MDARHIVTLHTRLAPGKSSVGLDQAASARTLVLPPAPAATHSVSAWTKTQPLPNLPNTRAYITTPPSHILRRRTRSPAPASPGDWSDLPEFQHWSPPDPDPIVPENDVGGAARVKKKVRIESPRKADLAERTSRLNHSESEKSTSPRKRIVSTPLDQPRPPTTSRTRSKSAKELVPATPEDAPPAKSERALAREDPALGIGAIQRCIPPPYHHIVDPFKPPEPYLGRQHPCRILHSFVDPALGSRTTGSSVSISRSDPVSGLNASPKTAEFLQPGRQGSWLVPISGPLPIDHTSRPIWYTSRPSPLVQDPARHGQRSLEQLDRKRSEPVLPIEWTSARLVTLWSFLSYFHRTSNFGRLRASCILNSSPPTRSTRQGEEDDDEDDPKVMPDYIKITIEANLALAFRTLLSQFAVSTDPDRSNSTIETERDDDHDDDDKWFKGRNLVWVDEMGRAILVA